MVMTNEHLYGVSDNTIFLITGRYLSDVAKNVLTNVLIFMAKCTYFHGQMYLQMYLQVRICTYFWTPRILKHPDCIIQTPSDQLKVRNIQ